MVPKQRKKVGKQGSFTYNYIFDAFCDLKLLASLRNFKSTSVGVLFLIKLQIFSSNCSEEILLWRCFWGFVFGLIVSNRKTHHMMSFVSAFFFLIFNEKVISVFTSTVFKTMFSGFHEKQQVLFFHIIYGTILSTCNIAPYHNWNFFGLSMVFYMSKIFLRYGYSVCILLLVFLQFSEMVQSFQMSNTLSNVALELLNYMLN